MGAEKKSHLNGRYSEKTNQSLLNVFKPLQSRFGSMMNFIRLKFTKKERKEQAPESMQELIHSDQGTIWLDLEIKTQIEQFK